MSKVKWTPEQEKAIWGEGGELLLSAAAGSGKTAVLSERAMRLIADPDHPVDAERLLIVTFTRAAAAEMKDRIYKKLLGEASRSPGNRQLQNQIAKLPYANISTIHSFCFELVKQYFQRLGVSPTLRIAEEGEIAALEREVLEEIIAHRYEQKDKSAFLELVEYLSGGKNDLRLVDGILQIYHFLRSLPFYENWCENRLRLYECDCISESIWGRVVLRYCLQVTEFALRQAEEAAAYANGDEVLANNYGIPISADMAMLTQLRGCLLEGLSASAYTCPSGFMQAQAMVMGYKHPPIGRKKGADESDKAYLSSARDHIKDSVENLKEQLTVCNEEQFLEDVADLKNKMQELFGMALELDRLVWEKKKELSAVDFSDLEHLTLKLLLTPTEVYGQFVPTELVEALSTRFDEIMVDECQDINEVQDLIFRTLSRNNLFMVGDVKQSIYSFRQARPELFVEKLKRAAPYDGVQFPAKLLLSNNFRSRSSVTGRINTIFARLMTEEVGGVDYNAEEYLYPGATFPELKGTGWEMHYLSKSMLAEDTTEKEYEAYYTAKVVKDLVESGYQVTDKSGAVRPVEYRDIALLLRSPKGVMQYYRNAFADAGIEILEEIGESFLTTNEIQLMISLLKTIDNPLLDVELLGVMLSPIGGFTPDEVAEIRLNLPKGRLYSGLLKARQTSAKAAALCMLYEELREQSAVLSASKLLMEIYARTSIHLIYRSRKDGERRYRNLMLLVEYLQSWEGRGCNGLFAVLRFIDSILERGDDLVAAGGDFSGNGVSIMSIHKSKGLEFPVVILGGASKRFNRMDINASVVLDNRLGFTSMRRDRKLKRQFKTLPLHAARIKATESLISEELRVLYVALTRAREKLLVIGMVKEPMEYLTKKETVLTEGRVSSYEVLSQNSYLDMLTTALAGDTDFIRAVNGGNEEGDLKVCLPDMKKISFAAKEEEASEKPEADGDFLEAVEHNLAFHYAYPDATQAPTKLSVSELAGKEFEESLFSAKPRFTLGDSISAAETGTAVHAFMQLCDLKEAARNPQAELERLVSRGILTKRQGSAVDIQKIAGFFRSSLWGMVENAERYLREYRFVSYLKDSRKGEFKVAEDGEKTVLQGISDLILLNGKSAILVDFKTDRVKNGQRLVELYQGQMELYKEMLSDTLDVTVEKALLYSFHLNCIVEIPL